MDDFKIGDKVYILVWGDTNIIYSEITKITNDRGYKTYEVCGYSLRETDMYRNIEDLETDLITDIQIKASEAIKAVEAGDLRPYHGWAKAFYTFRTYINRRFKRKGGRQWK